MTTLNVAAQALQANVQHDGAGVHVPVSVQKATFTLTDPGGQWPATSDITRHVVVSTNSDKTGYSLLLSQALSPPAATTGAQAHTVGEALNAARANGFGRWAITGTTLSLYGPDGTTLWRAFTLDSATAPTSRT